MRSIVIFLAVSVICLMNVHVSNAYDFRNISLGMTIDQVKAIADFPMEDRYLVDNPVCCSFANVFDKKCSVYSILPNSSYAGNTLSDTFHSSINLFFDENSKLYMLGYSVRDKPGGVAHEEYEKNKSNPSESFIDYFFKKFMKALKGKYGNPQLTCEEKDNDGFVMEWDSYWGGNLSCDWMKGKIPDNQFLFLEASREDGRVTVSIYDGATINRYCSQ